MITPSSATRQEQTLSYAAQLQAAAETDHLRKRDCTRLRLLSAVAKRLVDGEKDTDLRVSDVADAACIAHGTFYRYFTDREAAVEAVVSGFVSFIQDHLKDSRRGQAVHRRASSGAVVWRESPPDKAEVARRIDATEQMIGGHVVLKPEAKEQRLLAR